MKGREVFSDAMDECVSRFCSADLATNIPSASTHVDGNPAKVSPPKDMVTHGKDATTVSSIDKLEPIAIIGLSLRFPQEATSPQTFWQMLMEKRTAMTDVPTDRFNVNAFYGSGERKPGVVCISVKALISSLKPVLARCKKRPFHQGRHRRLRCSILFDNPTRSGEHGPAATMATRSCIRSF